MNFLLDETLPPKLARILALVNDSPAHQIFHLTDHFQSGTIDTIWLSSLDSNFRWAILTHDLNLLNVPQQYSAWIKEGHTIFFLARHWHKIGFIDQVWMVVRWWPMILQTATVSKPRETFEIPFKSSPSRLKKLSKIPGPKRGRRSGP